MDSLKPLFKFLFYYNLGIASFYIPKLISSRPFNSSGQIILIKYANNTTGIIQFMNKLILVMNVFCPIISRHSDNAFM